MTVEYFDLAQRLYAARSGQPVRRLAYDLFEPSPSALAVRARRKRDTTTVTFASVTSGEVCTRDRDALVQLAAHDAVISTSPPPMLLVEDTVTVSALEALARRHATDPDERVSAAAALCGWWAERAEHPGTSAVVNLLEASRIQFVLGTAPAAEKDPQVWRQWFGITDDTTTAMHDWATRFGGSQLLPLLAAVHENDCYSLEFARKLAAEGRNWSSPDTPIRAALGLRTRCDSTDLWEAALLNDPLWRRRATFTGHVTTGTVEASGRQEGRSRTVVVACDRHDSRLRADAAVLGWPGPLETMPGKSEQFTAEVRHAEMRSGKLIFELGTVRGKLPEAGQAVCLLPDPPQPMVLLCSRWRYGDLLRRDSWIATGRTPAPRRRPVPLDVLVAAADDDD